MREWKEKAKEWNEKEKDNLSAHEAQQGEDWANFFGQTNLNIRIKKSSKKKNCALWDSNPRIRRYADLNRTP